jgi:hypothetical protein
MTRPSPAVRSLAYLRAANPKRNIRASANGDFEIESGPDHYGDTFWSRIAQIAEPNKLTQGRTLLIDVTGDKDRIMLDLDA